MNWYKHYKGGTYKVLLFAKHTESEEELVIYQDVLNRVWARPSGMFFEQVINDEGKSVRRFELMKETNQ